MLSISGTLTSSGNSADLITCAASQWVEVWSLSIMAKAADITVTVKTGSTTKYSVLCPATGVGGVAHPSGHEPLFKGAAGEALLLNLSGAAASGVAYNIAYAIKGAL
jgi:hypothetical protein